MIQMRPIKDFGKSVLVKLLTLESKAILRKYKPKIVAITGTVGKTSTKEAIYSVLKEFEYVRRSPKSFNSELGVPLTVIGAYNPGDNPIGWIKVLFEGLILIFITSHYPDWLVLEVGTDRPGDIQAISEWLHPDIAVITQLAEVPVHVEAFASPEELYEEKGYLVKGLKAGGTLILNGDDEKVLQYRKDFSGETILFGQDEGSEIRANDYEVIYDESKRPIGITFNILVPGQEHIPLPVTMLGTLGESHIYHALAAMSVAKKLEKNLFVTARSLGTESPTPGRMRLIEGIKESVIIDDTYNSSPIALEEALRTLKAIKAKRKIAILGDMLELGKFAVEEHRKVGEIAAKTAKILVTVGVRSRLAAETALGDGMSEENVLTFDDSREAGRVMRERVEKGDLILIKGSQGMRMERAVLELMAHPEEKEKLLVRMDEEWKKR